MTATIYGAIRPMLPPTRRDGLGMRIVMKLAVAIAASTLILLGLGWRAPTDPSPQNSRFVSAEWVANEPWSCRDYEDVSSVSCALADREVCDAHCTSPWCASLCGDACADGRGAMCAYERLSDLATTCAAVEATMVKNGTTVARELRAAGDLDECRPTADVDDARRCDHHAWCGHCRGSLSCEAVVPKARSPLRTESGDCAAASLGRVVSICDEAGLLSARVKGTATRPTSLRKVYYINCDAARDRRDVQETQLAAWGIPYERFACVTAETLDDALRLVPGRSLRAFDHNVDDATRARTVGTWLSHYALFEKIARDDVDGSCLVLEDDAVLDPRFTLADIDRAIGSLPPDWAYASLNVHESYCLEDRVNEDWFLKKTSSLDASLYDTERILAGSCTLSQKDTEWRDRRILYLSAAAQLLRPSTAYRVTAWLDSLPIYHVDALLRTTNASAFPSFQFRDNLFFTATNLSETRRAVSPDASFSQRRRRRRH